MLYGREVEKALDTLGRMEGCTFFLLIDVQ